MSTPFDWICVALFAGLAVIFLQRSVGDRPAHDRVIHYLPPAIGCAVANYLGNHDLALVAVVVIVSVLAYVWYVIKPGRADRA